MTEHYCSEHNSKFYENHKGDKTWWSHKIAGTDKYCNEAKSPKKVEVPVEGSHMVDAPPTQEEKVKEPNYKSPVNRSIAVSYAKDLVVAGKIELKELSVYADKFLAYIEKEYVN